MVDFRSHHRLWRLTNRVLSSTIQAEACHAFGLDFAGFQLCKRIVHTKRVITATYEDSALKLSEKLFLEDHQEVLVIVVPLPQKEQLSADEQARAAQRKQQAEAWLSRQPADGVPPPLSMSESRSQELDEAFDAALAAIRARAAQFPAAEIAADVDAALAESRALSANDRARLEAELDAILAQIVTDVAL